MRTMFASGERLIGHIGSGIGYVAVLAYLQDFDVCFAVMLNSNSLECLYAIASAIAAAVIEHLS